MNPFKVGDIVKAKPEWMDKNETGEERYLVLEVQGDDRVLVQYIDIDRKFKFAPTHTYHVDWIEKDENPDTDLLWFVLREVRGELNDRYKKF